jgi:hypothetical protein
MFPRSWYMVCASAEVKRGPLAVSALGTTLTVRRDARGQVEVVGAGGQPRLAREVNQMVLVWEGSGEPDFEVPSLETDPAWTPISWTRSRVIRTTVEQVQQDAVDNAHLGPVHRLEGAETRAEQRGPWLDTVSQGVMNLSRLGGPPLLCHIRLDGRLHGLGLLAYRTTITLGLQIRSLSLTAPMPIDANHLVFHVGAATLRPLPGTGRLLRRAIMQSVVHDVEQDAVRWEAGPRYLPSPASPQPGDELFSLYEAWLGRYLPGGQVWA